MSSDVVLEVSGLAKKFCPQMRRALAYGLRDMAGELLPFSRPPAGLRTGEFWALNDIDFSLSAGEGLAIIGRNGAGKSTLLKILYGLIKPDRGEVRIRGRVDAILELGTGLNGLLTGRENVEAGAVLHSLPARDTRRLLDQVVDFADVGEFIDAPLQTYSSGMRSRLAFALAAHLEPDVLIVDEALAVGDLTFQKKAADHIQNYLRQGGALIFVSHNPFQIQRVCNRGLVLEKGEQVFAGSDLQALNFFFERESDPAVPGTTGRPASSGPVSIRGLAALPLEGDELLTGASVRIVLRYHAQEHVRVLWAFSIWTPDQSICLAGERSHEIIDLEPGDGELACVITHLPLVAGGYMIRGAIVDPGTKVPLDMQLAHGGASPMRIRGSERDVDHRAMGQIIGLDVDWGSEPARV